MTAKHNKGWLKIFIPVFYLVAMILLILYVWNRQSSIRQGGDGPLYRNLMECPAFVRRGFDRAYTIEIPKEGEWVRFQSPPLRISSSSLPDLPKLPFLSPRGKAAEEFTVNIIVEMDRAALVFINGSLSVVPGIYFAAIGENWEIFLNGKLVRSEIHLDKSGRFMERRTWRDIHFPLDKSLLVQGANILSLRIIGDPAYTGTGFFYTTPYYLDNYRFIEERQQNLLLVVLFSIAGFTGVYYLTLFLLVRRKQEILNLYYGIFAIMFCVYSICRTGLVNSLIPNSDIAIRLEYISLFMLVPALCLFFETFGRGKITKISWGYLAFCGFLSFTQIFFCAKYGDDALLIWNYTVMVYFSYVFFYCILYSGFWVQLKNKKLDTTMSHILVGSILTYACGIFDCLDTLFFHKSFSLFIYSMFVVLVGMAFTLSQRFSVMYKRLEQSNATLELAVQERTVELEELTRIAIQASRAKSQFLATMSHEIRTPLNAVIGLSEIVLRRGKLFEASRNDIQQIHQSGSSLLRIINDILDISKIEANSFELIPVEYETASLINDTISLNMVRIGSKPINFVLEINEDFPQKLYGDELRVKQILNNILSNAIKYTQKGQITFSVAWENLQKENEKKAMIRFTIRDTGMGMRKEDIEKLFSDYTQLDAMANRKVEGTGLGLAIAKRIVEMMDGSIAVESEYGKGSTFMVSFIQGLVNLTDIQTAGIGKETTELLKRFQYASYREEKNIERSWMPYGKVLVVDDISVNLRVASGLLEPYGLKVDTAASGLEAIEKLSSMNSNPTEEKYDLIFMDHMMPGMDGIKAVRFIRNDIGGDYCRNVPIVAFTANALVGNDEMFMSKGFSGFISKPINPVELDNALNKWVRDKQSPEILKQAEEEKKAKENAKEKISAENTISVFDIAGVDTKRGISATGGTEAGYIDVLAIFCKDVEDRLPLLQNVQDSDSLPSFVTQVHAIKSASASVGAAEISEEAARLEAAGKAGDFAYIEKSLKSFVERLAELVKNIHIALETGTTRANSETSPSENKPSSLTPLLRQLADELKAQNAGGINRIFDEINKLFSQQQPDIKTKETLEQISDQILMAEYEKALEIINSIV